VRSLGATLRLDGGDTHDNTIYVDGWGGLYGVWLASSGGSQIVNSTVIAQGADDPSLPAPDVVAVGVSGAADGISIAGNTIDAGNGHVATMGVELSYCASSVPSLTDNTVTATPSVGQLAAPAGPVWGIASGNGCKALLEGNDVSFQGGVESGATGIECSTGCSVLDNRVEPSVDLGNVTNGGSETIGVSCLGCAEVSRNLVLGLREVLSPGANCSVSSTGLVVSGDATLVDSNSIEGGTSHAPGRSLGVEAHGTVRIENNLISGGGGYFDCCLVGASATGGIDIDGAVDLSSNYVFSGDIVEGSCDIGAVSFVGDNTAVLRNNIVEASCGADLLERVTSAHPSVLESNDLVAATLGAALYRGPAGPDLTSIDDVNALTTSTASGNFSAACPFPLDELSACRDTGSTDGAPAHDFNAHPRDASPDVGPYEWYPGSDSCNGETCSGHGTCDPSGDVPVCTCDEGYHHPGGDLLTCSDIDECAAENGDCDPLVTCTNTPGGRTCGSCPSGYLGNGYFGCWLYEPCVPETIPQPPGGCPADSCQTDDDCDPGSTCRAACGQCGTCTPTLGSCYKQPLSPVCGCDCHTYFNLTCEVKAGAATHSSSDCGIHQCSAASDCPGGNCWAHDISQCAENGAWCLEPGVLSVKCP